MALSNRERIGRMLDGLAGGLKPVVDRMFTEAYGTAWVSRVDADRPANAGPADPNDAQFLLNAAWFHWNETLGRTLGPAEKNYVNELRLTRNRWAHPGERPFTGEDVYRAYDTAERLLRSVASPAADDVGKAKSQVLMENAVAQAKDRQKAPAVAATAGEPAKGLAPWRSVVTPHPDVAAGRYRQAEFAADLAQVARGEGAKEYVDPREFFARTYLTEGLRLLLTGALRRLAGTGGESVVDLQTTFGGGKTHSMLALWHLAAAGASITSLPGLEGVVADAGVASLPRVARAAIVGTSLSPITPRVVEGAEIRTLWGELAWQLGGPEGFARVAEADRAGVPPGADALRGLLAAYAPVVVLVDEWVTYARLQWGKDALPGGSFDAALSFAQQLTGAVDQVPGALLVVSLPSSVIEVGGEGGQKALAALKHVVHRVDAPWRPAAAQESFEIVRRRLFEPITAEAARSRDEVVQQFSELYSANTGMFPSDTKEKSYLERLRNCYPIHPELFDRLFDDWSTLERFQRTRGVLKLMAAVVHTLWEKQDGNLLILPGAIPLDDGEVMPQLIQYLDDGWDAIVEGDVDGTSSLPLRLDRENHGTYGRYSAARRVARTVFLGSAPLPAAANRGIDDKRILLGAVQPGETPATFGDALRKLAGQATYLYENAGRYWYSTQPSVNQLARDRADQQAQDQVELEIEARLKKALADRLPFHRIHAAPRDASDVPDEDEVALVALRPEHPHDAKGLGSKARDAAAAILASRGAGTRVNKNMLVFLAPDSLRLPELEDAVRQFKAWSSILADGDAGRLNLDDFGRAQAKSQRDSFDATATSRVPETYHWLLVPEQADALSPVELKAVKIAPGPDIAARAAAKLRSEELLITRYGGVNLRLVLTQTLKDYWGQHHEVGMRELWGWFAHYPYLPRLLDMSVLEGAVEDGVGNLLWRSETFAYAAAREAGGAYMGVVAGRRAPTPVTSTSLIVDGSLIRDAPARSPVPPVDDMPEGGHKSPEPPKPASIRRFHGQAVLSDPRTPIPELQKLVAEIIGPLAAQTEVSLTIRVEIEADHRAEAGFTDQTIRTVSENARTLRLRDFGFERE